MAFEAMKGNEKTLLVATNPYFRLLINWFFGRESKEAGTFCGSFPTLMICPVGSHPVVWPELPGAQRAAHVLHQDAVDEAA